LGALRERLAAEIVASGGVDAGSWVELDDVRVSLSSAAFQLPGTSEQVVSLASAINATRVALVDAVGVWNAEFRWAWDGARGAVGWLKDRCSLSHGEAASVVAVAGLCHQFAEAADALHGILQPPPVGDDGRDDYANLRGRGPLGLSFAQLAIWAQVVSRPRGEVFALHARAVLSACAPLSLRETKIAAAVWASAADDLLGLGTSDLHDRRGVRVVRGDDGMVHLKGLLDPDNGELLLTALAALDQPDADDAPGGPRSPAQRNADHVGVLAGRFLAGLDRPGRDDDSVGAPTHTVYVMVDDAEAGIGVTAEGTVIDRALMAMYSCVAWFSPLVVDDRGEPLWLGRRRRLFSASQTRAIIARDRGCRFPGCDAPPSWCDTHHVTHWQHGGDTDVDNGVLVCRHHHRVLHQRGWVLERGPDRTWRLNRWPPPPPSAADP
jgi:hypothetical protein